MRHEHRRERLRPIACDRDSEVSADGRDEIATTKSENGDSVEGRLIRP